MKWNKSNNYPYLQTHFLSHPAGQVIGVQGILALRTGSPYKNRDKKIAQTVEHGTRKPSSPNPARRNVRFPSHPTKIAKIVEHLSGPDVTATGFSIPIPTKIAKTAEQASRILCFLILIFGFSEMIRVSAQEEPRAIPVDEFGNPNCEELSARLDNLAIQAKNNPNSTAFITVTGKVGTLRDNLFKEGMIKTYFPMHKIGNWKLLRTGLGDEFAVKFWLVPNGARFPESNETDWSYEIPPGTKPFVFDWGDSYAEDICPAVNGMALLSDVLKANSKAKVHVVLRARRTGEYERRRRKAFKELTLDLSIPKNQIRFFLSKKRSNDRYGIDPDAEYWLVPPK